MISCSNARGISYNPISNFDCLSSDIPYLPVNRRNKSIKDVEVDVNANSSASEIHTNTIIHKIKLKNLSDNIDRIKIIPILDIDNNLHDLNFNIENVFHKDIILNESNVLLVDIDIENLIKFIKKNNNVQDYKICFKFIFLKNENVINENILKFNILKAIIKPNILNLNTNDKQDLSIYEMNNIPNGSIALCMDTGDVYKFDSEYDQWLKL